MSVFRAVGTEGTLTLMTIFMTAAAAATLHLNAIPNDSEDDDDRGGSIPEESRFTIPLFGEFCH